MYFSLLKAIILKTIKSRCCHKIRGKFRSFTYDDNGNRTQKTKGPDTWLYTYDYANRLTKVEKNDTTIGEYVYDGDGRRLQVTENSETNTYICAGLNILYEENTAGSATHIYGPTGRLDKECSPPNCFCYHISPGSFRLFSNKVSKCIKIRVTFQCLYPHQTPGPL